MKVKIELVLEDETFTDLKQFEYALTEGVMNYVESGEIIDIEEIKE